VPELTVEEQNEYYRYARWAVAPLMTREQWLVDHRLAQADWAAWCKRHGVG
jgi:hypothetical protein